MVGAMNLRVAVHTTTRHQETTPVVVRIFTGQRQRRMPYGRVALLAQQRRTLGQRGGMVAAVDIMAK